MKKSRISFGGHEIVVHEFGASSADSRAQVLAIHGFGVDGYRTFRHLDTAAAAGKLRIIAPDLLGFGESDKPALIYGLDLYSCLAKHVAGAFQLDRPILLGHSLGGKIALAAAVDHRPSFGGLVLVNSGGFSVYAPFLPLIAGRRWVVNLFARRWFNRHVVPRTPLAGFLSAPDSHEQLARFRESHASLDLDRTGYLSRIAGIDLPSLIIWGQDDPILPKGTPARIQQRLPVAALRYIPGAGHAPMKDNPTGFVKILSEFSDSVRG